MKKLFTFFFCAAALQGCTDMDDNLRFEQIIPDLENVISQDDTLFEQITQVTTDDPDPLQHIVCIDFVYPLTLITYDEDLEPTAQNNIIGDENFSTFLGNLGEGESISISYPISTTLEDGSVFTVNNNAELKIAIDSCNREDIITYCNGLFCPPTPCVWNVSYMEDGRNGYSGGVFNTNADGSLSFAYAGETYTGTWNFLFVNDIYHMNIHLGGDSEVAAYWNVDAPVIVTPDKITISHPDGDMVIYKTCEETDVYAVGEAGPGGGIVFYDKGTYSDGWRYLEAATADVISQWGCMTLGIPSAQADGIGFGRFNSGHITIAHDNLADFYTTPSVCSAFADGTVAAKKALLTSIPANWFLPAKAEMQLLYDTRAESGILLSGVYWTSTENDVSSAYALDAGTGLPSAAEKTTTANVCAIHYF